MAAHAARAVLPGRKEMAIAQLALDGTRIFAAYCRDGSGFVTGDAVEAELVRGDILLLRMPANARLRAIERLDMVFIGFPEQSMTARLGRVESLLGAMARVPDGFAMMLDGLAVAIGAQGDAPAPGHQAAVRAAAEFVCALIETQMRHGTRLSTHRQLMFARAKGIVALNLADPGFGATRLAESLGISQRYLRTLFAAEGLRASDYIAGERLRRGRRFLVEDFQGRRSIGEIARACGFASQSHFSRAIRSRFGDCPRQLRLAGGIATGPALSA